MLRAFVFFLRNGVNKTHQFLIFLTSKGGTKTTCALANCGGVKFLKLRLYDCKFQNEKKINPSVQ